MESTEPVWSDEQVRGTRDLVVTGPFADEVRTAELDDAAAVLEQSDHFDDRARKAVAILAGSPDGPIEPMQVMGGGGRTILDRVGLDPHIWAFAWPDTYFVPGNSAERWLGVVDCPPSQRYASGSASGDGCFGNPHEGRAFSYVSPPRSGVTSGVASGGVFAFYRPSAQLSLMKLAPEIDWTFESRYFIDWSWGRNYVISAQFGGALVLTAWVWNPATAAWERATNGLGGTVVSSTRQVMTTSDSGIAGSNAGPIFSASGHVDSGAFSVPVLVEAGRTYAFGVHAQSWWRSTFLPGHPSTPPPDPPLGAVKCWSSMKADVPFIWI
jgi:hypothetical protein